MIQINKGEEPPAWSSKKATPGFIEFEPITELRDALLMEQGYICAYCMRRIPVKDINIDAHSKIEHIKSQHDRPDLQLDYSNMAVCCPGNLNNESHCDKFKDEKSVTFNLHTPALQQSISYSTKDGTIKSSREDWNIELNNTLKLNHPLLKLNRRDTIAGVIDAIGTISWTTQLVKRQLLKAKGFNSKGQKVEYCGIIIWFLEKKIRQQ